MPLNGAAARPPNATAAGARRGVDHVARHQHLTALRRLCDTRGDVHDVTDDVVSVMHDIADVHAGPQAQRAVDDVRPVRGRRARAASGSGKVSSRPSPIRFTTRPPRLRTTGPIVAVVVGQQRGWPPRRPRAVKRVKPSRSVNATASLRGVPSSTRSSAEADSTWMAVSPSDDEHRRPLLHRTLEIALDHLDRRGRRDRLARPGILEPLPPHQPHLDRALQSLGIPPQQLGQPPASVLRMSCTAPRPASRARSMAESPIAATVPALTPPSEWGTGSVKRSAMILETIEAPADLRRLSEPELRMLAVRDPRVHRPGGVGHRRPPRLEPGGRRAHAGAAPRVRLATRHPAVGHGPPGLRAQDRHRPPRPLRPAAPGRRACRATRRGPSREHDWVENSHASTILMLRLRPGHRARPAGRVRPTRRSSPSSATAR